MFSLSAFHGGGSDFHGWGCSMMYRHRRIWVGMRNGMVWGFGKWRVWFLHLRTVLVCAKMWVNNEATGSSRRP